MRIENRRGYPRSWVNAIKVAYDVDRTDLDIMSATTLIAPRKVRILTARHYDDIVVDAEGEGHSLFGEAMHYVVSKAQDSSYICEERKYVNIDGKILTGKPDLYDKILNVIED
jgi:hypothetical protein